jgi:lipopolysaccharide transport system permease protein
VSIAVLQMFFVSIYSYLNWTVIFLPLVLLPFVLLTMGICWFLAATGVFLRDLAQTTGIVTTALLFLSPIFYPLSALPEAYRPFFYLNPLTFVIEQTRGVLIWGNTPDWVGVGAYFVISFLVASAGLFWFQKTRKGFADVL